MSIRAVLKIAVVFMLAWVPTAATAKETTYFLKHAIVEKVSERPLAGSGTAWFLSRIDIRTQKGERFFVLETYLSPEQFIPKPGDICDIRYRIEWVSGFYDHTSINAWTKLLSGMSCNGKSWVY
ncbi:MAG: hypothetical protein HY243_19165 [Proteobacteria bacterium]|nr:hypothetical protein [Pseudomonadota bacterium]